jgi:hypothetical protein
MTKKSKRIIRLEDARSMKAMDLPLDIPVIERGMLPEQSEKMRIDTMKAAGRCRQTVRDYLANQNEKTYTKLKRTHKRLGREIAKTLDADSDDRQLADEKEIARAFIKPHCFTAYQKWADIIASLESGNAVRLSDDAWPTETDRA